MTESSEAGDHLRAAADHLNDALTELDRAAGATDEDAVEALVEAHRKVASDLEDTLRQLGINADVSEVGGDDGDE